MTKEELKRYIDQNVYENPNGDISGEALNAVLKAIVDDGGTEVVANPTGEATETLGKLKIGETIYTAPQGPEGQDGQDGTDGVSPTVAVTEITGGWRVIITDTQGPHTFDVMNGQDGTDGTNGTNGTNGITPHIGDNGNWYIGDQDTGVQAEGQDGTNGTNGITPTINPVNKHWMIGETDTGIVAEGQNGQPGQPGPANTLSIGTVTDGEQASASITGNAPNQQLNLTLPAGKSAYNVYVDTLPEGATPMSPEQWLASLKATIGAFRFVDYDAEAEAEFTLGGIGTPYLGTVDSLEAGVDTNPSIVLLMNNTNGTTPPTKTFMIATQEDSPATEQAPATYVFVYIGDLQDAMPSDILTADDLFEESDSDFEIADENGNIICRFNNGHINTKYFNSEDTFNASEKAVIEKGDAGLSSKVTISDLPNVRNSYVISLYSEILTGDTFNGIKIAIDANSSSDMTYIRGWIEIDNSEIRVLKYGTIPPTTETYSHNLTTISDFIEVVVEPVAMHKAKFILYTNGGSYVIEDMPWYGCGGELSVEPLSGTSLSGHYEFGITYYGFNNRLWIFGDSWCDFWPGAIEKLGIKNFLLDGYGGRKSRQAVDSFVKCLEFGKPTYLIWIMGMNDSDTPSGGTYVASEAYKYAFEAMKMTCEELHIHFIPCTIVCGTNPSRHNTGKNQYIKDSGFRYIPLAEELGGTTDSDTGYKGLINQLDMAHPTDPAGSMKVALCLAKYISNIIKTN